MTLVVPQVAQVEILEDLLTPTLTLFLFSNNYVPVVTSVWADVVEVAGGGYASKSLTFVNWTITPATPSVALYNAAQDFLFTGTTNAPGTIYGYGIKDASNVLKCLERFPAPAVLPFTPVNGSLIRITPRITAKNAD